MSAIEASEILVRLAGCSYFLRLELGRVEEDWAPDEPPPTVVLGALGAAFMQALERLPDSELACVASIVEQALIEGSESAKDAVATGFLEGALSASLGQTGAARLLSKLGRHSRRYCKDWDRFCGVRTPGLWEDE